MARSNSKDVSIKSTQSFNGIAFEEDTKVNGHRKAASDTAAIDDPVRMYLMQMGEIPLLSRTEEISSAQQIDDTRDRFRQSMLGTDFMLQAAVSALEKVRDGELRLDRTIEVSVTNTVEKKRIMKRIVPNVATIRRLLQANYVDYRIAISKSKPVDERKAAWQRLIRRRNRAVRLVEELNLRTQRLLPLLDKLEGISKRMIRCCSN